METSSVLQTFALSTPVHIPLPFFIWKSIMEIILPSEMERKESE